MAPNLVYQFRITLAEVEPAVWRRIQVPAHYSFWDLHVAIQDAMGWWDSHLHLFKIKKPRGRKVHEIGIPFDFGFDEVEHQAGWKLGICEFFTQPGAQAEYEYDFGDGWSHEILLEGVLLEESELQYPRLLDGENACPPEDCGGPHGYSMLLATIADPQAEEYESTIVWLSGMAPNNQPFDPSRLDPAGITFDDPYQRFRKAFLEE